MATDSSLSYKVGHMTGNNAWVTVDEETPQAESDLTSRLVASSTKVSNNAGYKGYIRITPSISLASGQPKNITISFKVSQSRPALSRAFFNSTNNALVLGNSYATSSCVPSYSSTSLPYSDACKDSSYTVYSNSSDCYAESQTVYYRIDLTSVALSANTNYFIYIVCSDSAAPGTSSKYTTLWGVSGTHSVALNYTPQCVITYKKPDGTTYTTQRVDTGTSATISSSGPSKSNTTSTVTVTFNGNGGTPSKSTETATNTTSYSLASWNTNSSGTGSTYSKGSSYTINSDLTLYPIYSGSTSYGSLTAATGTKSATTSTRTVTFDANGGSCTTTSLNSSKTDTYTCNGWYTSTSGGTRLATSGGSMTPQSTRTVYAQWTTNSGSYSSLTLPTPSRTGYKFLGWATTSTATSGSTGSYTPASSLTLYAIWEALATMFVKVDGSYKAGIPYVKVNGEWKRATAVYVKVNGSWKLSTR